MSRRAGVSLVETLIVLVITGLLLGFVTATLRHQCELVRVQAQRAGFADALRMTDVVLQGELRWADPTRDLRAVEPGSVQVRAVRALAVVCGWEGTATVVRLRGMRHPDPDKDSVALVPGAEVLALRGAVEAPEGCPHDPDEHVYRLTLDELAPRGALLVFERGSYHLVDHAFRYRRGQAGRQPLTAEILGRGWFLPVSPAGEPGALDIHAEPRLSSAGSPVDFQVVFANAVPGLLPDTGHLP